MQLTLKCILVYFLLAQGFLSWGKVTKEALATEHLAPAFQDSLDWAEYYYNIHRFEKAIPLYKKNLDVPEEEKAHILKKLALSEAAIEHPEVSVSYLHDYLQLDFQPSFLLHEGFDGIRESTEFDKVSSSILPKITLGSLFYFFVALIGFYVVAILVLNKKIDLSSRILIGSFVFIHSLFILNICVNRSNYLFEFPHTYLMSTWSSLLYGPLLFLYFRRVSLRREFRKNDLLHFVPTVLLIAYLIPNIYWFPGSEKINLMLSRIQNGVSPGDASKLVLIVTLKALSLAIYAIFIHQVLQKSRKSNQLQSKTRQWQKNIYFIHIAYVVTYISYGISISFGNPYPIFYHVPIIMMAAMVVYVGYAANLQPDVFSGLYRYTNKLFPKYVKSGLTASLSMELRENLSFLFQEEKLYRRNDINLDLVAQKLNTTRHNASQIINEHFEVSFHEFVNQFRIAEAKTLLERNKDLNIIDIAYEVGYNNKVTFNKAFKKATQLTPTEYLRNIEKKKSPSLSGIGHF